uniref:NADH-ubiquinone oxidoreductase chain 6 n=1 Tax=Lingula anatina TaxID=7574 RepID=Q5W906_LINAN|nr:NADH dehydrogenase subunit 6 [Lingula anatina]
MPTSQTSDMVAFFMLVLATCMVVSMFLMLVSPTPMQLSCSLIGFFVTSSCLVALIVHPWVGAILFLIYGGVILVAFVYVLAMDPSDEMKISKMDWHLLKVVPLILAVSVIPLFFGGWMGETTEEVVFLSSPDGYFLPLFNKSNRVFMVITLASLAGMMAGALKLICPLQGALRPMTDHELKGMGLAVDSKNPKKAKIFWSL